MGIRTMAKAEYNPNNIGHFGLGFEHYCHFTSPIRRYSDVVTHRILEENFRTEFRVNKSQLEAQCKHISNQERKAQEAERASIKYKQVEYISQYIGQSFIGLVNGMIDRGIFIELVENKVEGLLGFDKFTEPYELSESGLSAKGKRSGNVIKMGDPIEVVVLEADLQKRQVEFGLSEK